MIAVLFTGLIGLIFVYLGVITLNGAYKRWYLGPRVFPPQAIVYGTLPFGIGGVVLSIVVLFAPMLDPDTVGWAIALTAGPPFLFGYILAIWRPWWIKPRWVRWLEENYGDRIHDLIAAARRDPKSWERRVATQEGLEQWAREVAGESRLAERKHKAEMEEAVRCAIEAFNPGETFTAADLERACTGVSRATILHVLAQLRAQGRVECTGQGQLARWYRV